MERRILRSRDLFIRTTPWAKIPSRPHVLVVDAKLVKAGGEPYTIYLVLVRPQGRNIATILPPHIVPGKENQKGWQSAFATLPPYLAGKTRAIVCDGHRGPVYWARKHSILIQRCHFHLLSSIRQRRSRWKRNGEQVERENLYGMVKEVISTKNEKRAEKLLLEIDNRALDSSSVQLRVVLRGFIESYEYYRMYRYHPELHLPTTTNAAESYISSLQEFLHRTRGFRTLSSLSLWVEAFFKHKRTIACNGFQQKKRG